ncbi:Predicted ATPase [Asanoa ishikariensis]|uniref:Predicted ATPase n=1 Tax=Asanoa ishikariensis TaxID=137265 RepID=A0A1H3UBU2_9ACTN|nr:DUF4062 domain-containing protein [Asanoa ishikariensis]SDZ59902.1 Predicted ATPase [Asanoa ishikariensis]
MTEPPIGTPDQRVRVFVSSTLHELAAERWAVREAVTRLRLTPVFFEQSAQAHPPREVYRAYLAQSHLFVGVYGESYGWVAPDTTMSGLEDEYLLARELSLPRLIYVKRSATTREPRLAAMIDGIRSSADVSYREFTDPAQLRDQVEQDIAVLLTERFHQSGRTPQGEAPPSARTPLIGRETEVAALTGLLAEEGVPLVTLTGPGGVGKTRLATDLAVRLADRFPDGVRYIDLSAVSRTDLVGEAMARSLGLRTSGAGEAVEDVAAFLRSKRLLLVVDNFEQVAEAAPVVARLLRAAPRVTALVTSRAPLRIDGERVYAVAPLSSPSTSDTDPAAAAAHASVQLFVERSRAAEPGFALTEDNVDAVAEICRRLDGLPLAIELAAARVRLMRPAGILDLLDSRLSLLTSGARDLPARQRTLRDTIAWSYNLLGPEEKSLFTRLSVFTGGFDLPAARAIGGPGALDALDHLVENSLVDYAPDTSRFGMLQSIREYGMDRLDSEADGTAAHRAHADYFHDVALEAGPELNRRATRWLRRLAIDHDNVVTATYWYFDNGEYDSALAMNEAIWVYWLLHGPIEEAGRISARIHAHGDRLPDPRRSRALLADGVVALITGDYRRGRSQVEEALPLLRAASDDEGVVRAIGPLAMLAIRERDYARARGLLEEGRQVSERLDERWQISLYHSRLGLIALGEGDHDRAAGLLVTALDVAGAADAPLASIVALYSLAVNAVLREDVDAARNYLLDGLVIARDSNDLNSPSLFIAAIADASARRGDHERATRLAAAATSLRQASGTPWLAWYVPPWPGYQPVDAAAYAQARTEGATLDLDGAMSEALRD